MASRFRQVFKWITPSWLSTGDGERVLHSVTLLVDAMTERLRQGLEARMPSRAPVDALQLLGLDRCILRGRSETAEHYAARLVRWRYPRGHRARGSAYALLEQISEYFGGLDAKAFSPRVTSYRTAEGVESSTLATWTWDTQPASNWARFWLAIDGQALVQEQPDLGDPALWGGALGTTGTTIGQIGTSADDTRAIRSLLTNRAWRPAGTQPEWLMVTLNNTWPEPDATWERWSKIVAGVQRRTRGVAYRYWSLDPAHNNTPTGDPDNFCSGVYLPGGALYEGNPDSFPASTTLPSGAVYAGNPNSFPTSARLVDDGDLPQ